MKKIIVAVSFLVTSVASAGPLGLEMGAPLAQLQKQMTLTSKTGEAFVFDTKKVPNSHPDLATYSLVVTPKHGLCKVIAATGPIHTSVFGDDLIEKFNAFKTALDGKYGAASDTFDFVRKGSLWDDPEDWMMGLLKDDRSLATYWTSKTRTLPDNIKSIGLEAGAIRNDVGYVRLGYDFLNIADCMAWMKERKDSSL